MKATPRRVSIKDSFMLATDSIIQVAPTFYCAIFQRDGKQVKRSLKTTDPGLVKRWREERRRKVERLAGDSGKSLPFAEYDAKTKELIGRLAKRLINLAGGTMEASSRRRMLGVIKNLNQHFSGLTVHNVTVRTLEQWATVRRDTCSPHTFNYERETLGRIPDYWRGTRHAHGESHPRNQTVQTT